MVKIEVTTRVSRNGEVFATRGPGDTHFIGEIEHPENSDWWAMPKGETGRYCFATREKAVDFLLEKWSG